MTADKPMTDAEKIAETFGVVLGAASVHRQISEARARGSNSPGGTRAHGPIPMTAGVMPAYAPKPLANWESSCPVPTTLTFVSKGTRPMPMVKG